MWSRHGGGRPTWDRGLAPTKHDLNNHLHTADPLVHGFGLLNKSPFSKSFRLKRTHSVGSQSSDTEAGLSHPLLHHHDDHATARRKKSIFGLPLILPTHWLCLVQLVVMGAVDATYTAFKVPITFAVRRDLTVWSVSSLIDVIAGLLFTLDMFLRFHIAVPQKTDTRVTIIPDGWTVAKEYMLRGSFVIDFLSTVPSYLELMADELHEHFKVSLGLLNALRLLRLLRLGRFVQGVFVLSLGGQVGRKLMGVLSVSYLYLINIMYAMLVLINLMGCAWLFTAEMEGAHLSWLTDVDGQDIHDAPAYTKYISALHFATTTMATVGYGDVSPKNNLERLVAMLIMIAGVIFFGFMISALGELLQHAGQTARRASLLHNKIQDVEAWLTARDLPRKLRHETVAFFCDAWIGQADVHEAELLAELPRSLKGKIVLQLLKDVFNNSQLFMQLDHGARAMLSSALLPKPLLPGHDLCHPGDEANCLWILQKGVIVAVTKAGDHADVLYAPALIGEASLLIDKYPDCKRRSCGFRAQESCMVWELGMDDLHSLLFTHPQLKQQMLEGFHQAIKHRMQHNPRARWKKAVSKLQAMLHPHTHKFGGGGGGGAGASNGPPGSSTPEEPESASGSSQGSEDEAEQTLKHSMDVMYNKELAMSIAEQVGRLIKEEREGAAARAVEEQSSSGRPPTYVSPFGRIQRSNSKVQFADSSDGEQSGPKR